MKRPVCSFLALCFILTSFYINSVDACRGILGPGYEDTTDNHDLVVGSDLVVNCSIYRNDRRNLDKRIKSSELEITTYGTDLSEFTRRIDNYTVEMRIPNTTVNHSGLYFCYYLMSPIKHLKVCKIEVNIGYPPHPVKNFSCTSRNFENIKCSWSTEENKVPTTYTIKTFFMSSLYIAEECPNATEESNSCEWPLNTMQYPHLPPIRFYTFTIFGNNSLGNNTDIFRIHILSVVILNSPINLTILNVSEQTAAVTWNPPTIKYPDPVASLIEYQIWLSTVFSNSSDVTDFVIYDIKKGTTSFLLQNLIPHVTYNVSIRCRFIYAKKENMWSNFTSAEFRTLADVPYKAPDVIPEAFELHVSQRSRTATLYWKAVPKLFHNGNLFRYHIKQYRHDSSNHTEYYAFYYIYNSSLTVYNLQKNLSYTFLIYSSNEKGISKDYGSIFIDSQYKIPPAPKNIRVILQDNWQYNVTWSPPNDIDAFKYIVFWCSCSKPWLSECDNNSIHWTNESLSDTNILLNISEAKSNYTFFVASKSKMSSSGMERAFSHYSYIGVAVNATTDDFLLENPYPNRNYTTKIITNGHSKINEDNENLHHFTLTEGSETFNKSIVCGIIGAMLFVVVLCLCIIWLKYKIPQVKTNSMKLPPEQKSPETMALEREKYVVFGRKHCENNSKCSSLSCSFTSRIQVSSGNKAENDSVFLIPPSPDSSITTMCLHNPFQDSLPIQREEQN